jgi:hypothetical protein
VPNFCLTITWSHSLPSISEDQGPWAAAHSAELNCHSCPTNVIVLTDHWYSTDWPLSRCCLFSVLLPWQPLWMPMRGNTGIELNHIWNKTALNTNKVCILKSNILGMSCPFDLIQRSPPGQKHNLNHIWRQCPHYCTPDWAGLLQLPSCYHGADWPLTVGSPNTPLQLTVRGQLTHLVALSKGWPRVFIITN